METMLATISGQFTKSIILGVFLPVVLFVLLGAWLITPLLPPSLPLLTLVKSLDRQWFLFAFTFLIILISGFLYNLNVPIIRLYEGYPWRNSRLGRWLTKRQLTNLQGQQTAFVRLRALRETLKANNKNDASLPEVKAQLNIAARLKFNQYPEAHKVLPTRLGNMIRSFEDYPWRQYRMASVTLWSRIVAVAPKGYVAIADDSKTSLDFFLNCSFLSAVLIIWMLSTGFIFHVPFVSTRAFWLWLVELAFFTFLLIWCYQAAIVSAAAWGEQVKGVFDLYRFDLLRSLGYKDVPTTREEERQLWESISTQMLLGDPEEGSPAPYVRPLNTIVPDPAGLKIEVASGIKANLNSNLVIFTYRIRNADQGNAARLELRQALPQGFYYEWGSAEVAGAKLVPLVSNPLSFQIGALAAGDELSFTFSAIQIGGPVPSDGAHEQSCGPTGSKREDSGQSSVAEVKK